jgi:hypothetical protein
MLKQKRESLITSIPRAIYELKQRHLEKGIRD